MGIDLVNIIGSIMSKYLFLLTILGVSYFGISKEILANDSSAAIKLGGLELVQNDSVSLEREELYLSADKVRVVYQFKNMTDTDVETLASFPIPRFPEDIPHPRGERDLPDFKEFEFKTTVDGVSVKLNYSERVEVNGQDVRKRLKELNWPFLWSKEFYNNFIYDLSGKLSEDEKKAFIKEGLLINEKGLLINKKGDRSKAQLVADWFFHAASGFSCT